MNIIYRVRGGRNSAGKKEGEGTNPYMNEDRYAGVWKNNIREGKGTMYFASGAKFEGAWANNAMHCAGIRYLLMGSAVLGVEIQ